MNGINTATMSSYHDGRPNDADTIRRPPGCLLKSLSSASSDGSTRAKNVSFGCIEIREFPIELSDNPAVHEGPPIQIGWTPQKVDILELDVYEVFRHRRRDRHSLAISTDERTARLLDLGYTPKEILAAMNDVANARRERRKSAGLDRTHLEMIPSEDSPEGEQANECETIGSIGVCRHPHSRAAAAE